MVDDDDDDLADASMTISVAFRPGSGVIDDDRRYYMVALQGVQVGQRYALGDGDVIIGRSEQAEIHLLDSGISRKHCRISVVRGEVAVLDLGARNGTYIDGKRIESVAVWPPDSKLEVGSHVFKLEYRSESEVRAAAALEDDLKQAAGYVRQLFPEPLRDGAVRTDWAYVPSALLGGDAFGYHFLDQDHFAVYLLDVAGHGAGSALHAVSVVNVLRARSLPDTDFSRPGMVLTALNRAFAMERHAGLCFSIWYGIVDLRSRCVSFASGGHPPALLRAPGSRPVELRTRKPSLGIMDGLQYPEDSIAAPRGTRLYLFSDGAFEITTREGQPWGLTGFIAAVEAGSGELAGEAQRLMQCVTDAAGTMQWEDDASLIVLDLP